MATTLYIADAAAATAMSGYTTKVLNTIDTIALLNTASVATTAGGNHLELTTGGTATCWALRINAVTISGTISFQYRGVENAMQTNARAAYRVARFDSAGAFVSDVVANANAGHPDDVELGTSLANMTWSATPTSTSFSSGDWLVVVAHADNIGTMAVGTVSMDYDGGSDASFLTFTETITEFTAAAANPPRSSPYPQLLAQ